MVVLCRGGGDVAVGEEVGPADESHHEVASRREEARNEVASHLRRSKLFLPLPRRRSCMTASSPSPFAHPHLLCLVIRLGAEMLATSPHLIRLVIRLGADVLEAATAAWRNSSARPHLR